MQDERDASRTGGAEAERDRRVDQPGPPTDEWRTGRRTVLLAGLGLLLGGCASSSSRPMLASQLPDVPWDAGARGSSSAGSRPAGSGAGVAGSSGAAGSRVFDVNIGGLQPRSAWGAAPPQSTSINPMRPIEWITIHHEGVSYTGRTRSAARSRVQSIQATHQRQRNWADIGYHFLIDRQGLVWQGREMRYQGAHVSGQNEGNIGVMLMGNFQEQRPTSEQVAGLQRTVLTLQRRFRVPVAKVRTHQEWPTAATECPGRILQAEMNQMRRQGRFA